MAVVGTAYVRLKVLSGQLGNDIRRAVTNSLRDIDMDAEGGNLGNQLASSIAQSVTNNPDLQNAGHQIGQQISQSTQTSIQQNAVGKKAGRTIAGDLEKAIYAALGKIKLAGMITAMFAAPSVISGVAGAAGLYVGAIVAALGPLTEALSGAGYAIGATMLGAVTGIMLVSAGLKGTGDEAVALQERFKGLGERISNAMSPAVVGRFNEVINSLKATTDKLRPGMQSLAGNTAQFAANFTKSLTQGRNLKSINVFLKSTSSGMLILAKHGDSFARAFALVLEMLGPVFTRVAKLVSKFADWAADTLMAKKRTGELADVATRAMDALARLGRIGLNIFRTFGNVMKAAQPAGASMMKSLEDITDRMEKWTGSDAGQKKMLGFFTNARILARELNAALGQMLRVSGSALAGFDPGPIIGIIQTLRSEVGPALAEMFNAIKDNAGDSLTKLLNAIFEGITALAESGVIGTVTRLFATLLEAVVDFASSDTGQEILKFVAIFLAVSKAIKLILIPLAAIKAAFIGTGVAAATSSGFVAKFGLALKTLFKGLGGWVTLITGIVAGFTYLYQSSEGFRNFIQGIIDWFKDLIDYVKTNFKPFIDMIVKWFVDLWGHVKRIFNDILNAIVGAWNSVVSWTTNLWNTVYGAVSTAVNAVKNAVVTAFNAVINAAVTAWNAVKNAVVTAWNAVTSAISTALNWIKNTVTSVWNSIVSFFVTVGTAIGSAVSTAWNAVGSAISSVMSAIRNVVVSVWNGIRNAVVAVGNAIRSAVVGAWNAIRSAVTATVNALRSAISSAWNAIKSAVTAVMSAVRSVVTSVWNAIRSTVTSVVNAIRSAVTSAWNAVRSATSSVFNAVKSVISSVWNGIKSTVSSVVNAIKNTISSVWRAISSTVSGIVNGISSTVSSVWRGISSTLSGIVNGIKSTVTSVWTGIKSAVTTTVNGIKTAISGVWNGIKSGAQAAWNLVKNYIVNPLKSAYEWVTGTFGKISSFFSELWSGIVSTAKSIFGGISDAVGTAFSSIAGIIKAPINGVIGVINNVAIGGLNSLINAANKIPFVDIPHIPNIPYLAKGGVVSPSSEGTLAIIAEAGRKERVEPLDRNGLSNRDRAMIELLSGGTVSAAGNTYEVTIVGAPGMAPGQIWNEADRQLGFIARGRS